MNLNPIGVMALLAGIVLMYSGAKNKYPADVIREALGKKPLKGAISADLKAFGSIAGDAAKQLAPTSSAQLSPATGVTIVTV